jgi:hypothetical protein
MGQSVDQVQAVYVAASNSVRGFLQPQSYGRKVQLMAVAGPPNSQLTIYRGYVPNFAGTITNIFPADVRTYTVDAGSPIDIRAGEPATFDWTNGAVAVGQTATCNVISEVY